MASTVVLEHLDLRIDMDDRIALLGANGNGKSTFAKLLAGRLAPLAGEIVRAPKLRVGYFAQHQIEELEPERTPLQHLADVLPDQRAGAPARPPRRASASTPGQGRARRRA